jgi:putative component of toxin-antitoxin plasmid stabilization module
MERYLGLDVHAESCTFSILGESGKEIRREMVETNGKALVGFLKQLPGTLHLCVEEGEWSPWLYEILSPHVVRMVVVWPEAKRGAKSDAPSVGPGVNEIRVHTALEHRVLFVAKFEEAVYVLHAFEKKSRKTRDADLALARERLRQLQFLRRKGKEK